MSSKPLILELCHAVAGRARVRPEKPMAADALKDLGESLGRVPGLRRVLVRPNTGSLILEFEGAPEPLIEAVAAQGIARIRPPAPPPPIGQIAQMGLLRADLAVKNSTQNVLDLNSAAALVLMGGAVIQLARGQIAGPAATLALAAVNMLDRGRMK